MPVRKSLDSEEQKMKVERPLEITCWVERSTDLRSNPSPLTPDWVTLTSESLSLSLNFLICKVRVYDLSHRVAERIK